MVGYFVTIFVRLEKAKVLSGIRLNTSTLKYNVCSIKLEMKVLLLREIRFKNISIFSVNKYVVHNVWLLPANVTQIISILFIQCSSISLTCSLRCIITTLYILYTCHYK